MTVQRSVTVEQSMTVDQSEQRALASAITWGFPPPHRLVRHAFVQLRVARAGTEGTTAKQGGDVELADLPRPWDPPTCPPTLRTLVWVWLDRVAAWINHEYVWIPDRTIPSCWPAHPHVAHELAVVASLRYDAGFDLTAAALEDWHRYSLPWFFDRLGTRLGASPCPPGTHTDWPTATRFKDFEQPTSVARRGLAITEDRSYTAPRWTGRPARPAGTAAEADGRPPRQRQTTRFRTSTPTEDGRDE